MVIRPVLTYGSMVWWPRVRYNVSRTELSKIPTLGGDEDNRNSCNGGSPGTSSSSCDDLGGGPGRGLQANV
jgi:hypothetical protein